MTATPTIATLALLFTWIFGGFLLRAGGLLLVFAGATVLTLSGNANGILVAASGAVRWLLGDGHYALRHGVWKSRVAAAPWSSARSALSRLVDPALHHSEGHRAKRRLAGAETHEARATATKQPSSAPGRTIGCTGASDRGRSLAANDSD